MKFILVAFLVAQVAVCSGVELSDQRGLMDIWDVISPYVSPVAQTLDQTIGVAITTFNQVSNAVTNAAGSVTSWIGGLLPALGKRDVSLTGRLSLLQELRSFQTALEQVAQRFMTAVVSDPQSVVSRLPTFVKEMKSTLQTHLNLLNNLTSSMASSVSGVLGEKAIASVLNAIQVIQNALQAL